MAQGKSLSKGEREQILLLYRSGISKAEIARRADLSWPTVAKAIKEGEEEAAELVRATNKSTNSPARPILAASLLGLALAGALAAVLYSLGTKSRRRAANPKRPPAPPEDFRYPPGFFQDPTPDAAWEEKEDG